MGEFEVCAECGRVSKFKTSETHKAIRGTLVCPWCMAGQVPEGAEGSDEMWEHTAPGRPKPRYKPGDKVDIYPNWPSEPWKNKTIKRAVWDPEFTGWGYEIEEVPDVGFLEADIVLIGTPAPEDFEVPGGIRLPPIIGPMGEGPPAVDAADVGIHEPGLGPGGFAGVMGGEPARVEGATVTIKNMAILDSDVNVALTDDEAARLVASVMAGKDFDSDNVEIRFMRR